MKPLLLRCMSLLLAPFGHAEAVATCPLLGEERKSMPTFKMIGFDPLRTSARSKISRCCVERVTAPAAGGVLAFTGFRGLS